MGPLLPVRGMQPVSKRHSAGDARRWGRSGSSMGSTRGAPLPRFWERGGGAHWVTSGQAGSRLRRAHAAWGLNLLYLRLSPFISGQKAVPGFIRGRNLATRDPGEVQRFPATRAVLPGDSWPTRSGRQACGCRCNPLSKDIQPEMNGDGRRWAVRARAWALPRGALAAPLGAAAVPLGDFRPGRKPPPAGPCGHSLTLLYLCSSPFITGQKQIPSSAAAKNQRPGFPGLPRHSIHRSP